MNNCFFIEWFRGFKDTLDGDDKPVMKTKRIDNETYYWVNTDKALSDLPRIYKNRKTLRSHISELIKKGFLLKHIDKKDGNRLYFGCGIEYYRYTTYINSLVPKETVNPNKNNTQEPREKSSQPLGKKVPDPWEESSHNSSVTYSSVINKKKENDMDPAVISFCERFEKVLADKKPNRLLTLKRKSKSYKAKWTDTLDKLIRIDGVKASQLTEIITAIESGTCNEFNRGYLESPAKLRQPDRFDADNLPVVWRVLRQLKPATPDAPVQTPEQKRKGYLNEHIWEYVNGDRDVEADISAGLIDASAREQVNLMKNN